MPSKVKTETGFKAIIDRKVSNGDGTFTDIIKTIEWSSDGNHKTLWQKPTASNRTTWDSSQAECRPTT
jgi:hypothetical protein